MSRNSAPFTNRHKVTSRQRCYETDSYSEHGRFQGGTKRKKKGKIQTSSTCEATFLLNTSPRGSKVGALFCLSGEPTYCTNNPSCSSPSLLGTMGLCKQTNKYLPSNTENPIKALIIILCIYELKKLCTPGLFLSPYKETPAAKTCLKKTVSG